MKVPNFIKQNLLLKMTSLNAVVISIRLVVSLFIQRLLAELVGEAGVYKIGQLRSLTQLLTSFTSLGVFNGIVKYVSEHKEDKEQLQKLFSTTFVFAVIGTSITGTILFFCSNLLSQYLFGSESFSYLIKLLAIIVPFIAVQRVFNGVVNGLSKYKQFAKIELLSYLISAALTILFLFKYNIDGALVSIAIAPFIQVSVMLFIFVKVLKEYVQFSKLSFKIPLAKSLLAFSLMSFVSTVLLSYIEIDIRSMLAKNLTEDDAGIWTAMTFISKNYMVFSGSIFTLYVIPKFAGIYTKKDFKFELVTIYKTLLPIFGVGMLLVYLFRDLVIEIIYPGFVGMSSLFKWQLLGDFVRLASLVLAHQFLAKKMVRNFIFSEVLSLALFYGLAYYLSADYGVEGVVMAHFIRYVIYFFVVFFLVFRYFKKNKEHIKA
ncbi:MAG: O-antigen translocase [Flavobacteriaceae bacterium]|nr:O-antigen translocase [Flavobacteriaceae bacterium]